MNPIVVVKNAGRGTTPDCPFARFGRGDVVKLRKVKAVAGLPAEAVVAAVVPPGFPPEYALADLLKEPRPLMVSVPRRNISYILVNEGDLTPYCVGEIYLLPSGKPAVDIGTVSREQ